MMMGKNNSHSFYYSIIKRDSRTGEVVRVEERNYQEKSLGEKWLREVTMGGQRN